MLFKTRNNLLVQIEREVLSCHIYFKIDAWTLHVSRSQGKLGFSIYGYQEIKTFSYSKRTLRKKEIEVREMHMEEKCKYCDR